MARGKVSYLRLVDEINALRFDSAEADAAVEANGAPARVLRALARARHHEWASARAELHTALREPEPAPLLEFVAGVALHVVRDYDGAQATLARAASRGKPGIARRSRMIASRFASELGWSTDARELEVAPNAAAASEPEQSYAERAASALARGDIEAALACTGAHQEDPRLAHLRARALLEIDEIVEAIELLERARASLPRAVPINLALAIAWYRADPLTLNEGLERRFEELLAVAPALLAYAAARAGLELWTDTGPIVERQARAQILTHAFASLSVEADLERPSYVVRHVDGVRFRYLGPALEQLHADDHDRLDEASATLLRALSVNPPRPRHFDAQVTSDAGDASDLVDAPAVPRSLGPEQIEQFLADGFLTLPRAFDPELARRWREDANRRIREEPERWVHRYDPADEQRSLSRYSPDDPTTWTWERIRLDGPTAVSIDEVAPTAWAAICELLGGPVRVATRTWTNNMIVNFGVDPKTFRVKRERINWHIDDPSPTTRLDSIVNGLLCLILYDDLHPNSGNTWIVPDSVARVARELAAHPEGVDFITFPGEVIINQCQRFHEVVGECGDVILMHPLLMHSSTTNYSQRIRWASNPMIYLNAPLDPFRSVAELSPVELAIHRAIT